MTIRLLAALLVGGGLALVVTSVLARVRAGTESLADILDLPFGEHDVDVERAVETSRPVFEGTVRLAGQLVDQFDTKGSLSLLLERAALPFRPGEYVALAVVATFATAGLSAAVTEQPVLGGAVGIGVLAAAVWYPRRRIERRKRAISEQLPDAISLVASSLSAGNTFLRAIQQMVDDAEPPISEEFARVVQETRLGDPVVDALERMALRVGLRDLHWIVQAIRVQQTVGGKLADLLHSMADFIRAREEVRREVAVLTAEGRISAYVLAALPVFLLLAIQVSTPSYLAPMFDGWGLVVLAATAVSVVVGTVVILRMVKIEV
jgi:tight adherence protein B